MNEASKQALLSALRSILIAAGSSLGLLSETTLNEVVGAVMVIIPIAWGIWDKFRAEAATQARETVAVNVGIAVADRTAGATPPVPSANVPAVIEAFAPVAAVAPDAPKSATGLAVTPSSPVLPTEPKGTP